MQKNKRGERYPTIEIKLLKKIRRFLGQGNSLASAGREFGLSTFRIQNNLRAHGIPCAAWEDPSKRTHLSAADIKTVIRMFKESASQEAVCKELNIHVVTFKKALARKGVKIDHNWGKIPEDKINRASQLFAGGVSRARVSEAIGVSTSVLDRLIRTRGCKRPVNFKMTSAEIVELVRLLKSGRDRGSIADRFMTTEYFIRLMIIRIGAPAYFKKPRRHWGSQNTYKSPDEDLVQEFIKFSFVGGTKGGIVKQLGTTRPTMDKILNRIEADYMEGL